MNCEHVGRLICSRSNCSLTASRLYGQHRLCDRHYRLSRIRTTSQRRGKRVPVMSWLESNIPNPFVCPHCKRELVWNAKENRSRVLTIQHDHNGNIRFLCQGCNSRHWRISNDGFYRGRLDQKHCARCSKWKPLSAFHKGDGYMGRSSMCRSCDNKRVAARREKLRKCNLTVNI